MTTLREAAQQALTLLELVSQAATKQVGVPLEIVNTLRAALVEDAMQKFTDVNQEIEAALAEPVQDTGVKLRPVFYAPRRLADEEVEAIIAASSQRKPLTEEEILSLFRTSGSPTAFARAIERAHGIT